MEEPSAQAATSHPSAKVVAAFILLAVLAGPVSTFAFTPFAFSTPWQTAIGSAASSAVAGVALLLISVTRNRATLNARQWRVLIVLLLPQFALASLLSAPAVRSMSWLHPTNWGTAFLLTLAAPLWLALLSAMQIVSVQVPRLVVGAAIAGIAAVCLVVPTDAYSVSLNQIPVLLLKLVLNVGIVFTWAYAVSRLAGVSALAAAGWYLMSSALVSLALSLIERSDRHPIEWRAMAFPLLIQAAVLACMWMLWFWLLMRMSLAAFGMRALAMWTASLVPGLFGLGYLDWRVDLALAIALTAIVIALRARVSDEQPTVLGLRGT